MNYNSLMNKPTINYRELIGDNSVTEVGGITEEQFNTLLSTDLSSYYTKAQIDDLFSRSYVYREKSGNIVTFDCPATVNGIDKVVSEIVAAQDLHGYDNPWVGGAGKNKLKNEYNGTTWVSVDEYGVVTINGTVPGVQWISINAQVTLKAGTYTLSGTPSNAPTGMYIYDDSSFGGWSDTNGQGATKTFQEETTGRIAIRVPAGTYNNIVFKPMIEVGSTKTSFAPYTNICPINGWSAVNVVVSPTTDAEDGTTYTTTLKDGQGNPLTCYGGTLDVVSGVLTVDRAYYKYINVSTTSGIAVTDGWRCNFTCPIDDINRGKWSIQTDSTPIFNKISIVAKGYGANEYTVTLPNVTSKVEADAMLEGLEICYKLATPQTIQLTPTAVKSLLGTNNIWADSGDITVKALDKIIQE